MANGKSVANVVPAAGMMHAVTASLTLPCGRKVTGGYAGPDMSRIPPVTVHQFATNGIIITVEKLETLAVDVEKALRQKKDKQREQRRNAAREAREAREVQSA